tara:strand:+ start:4277 stop:4465 length:189 start_codon:yes stop_codon:yes gene_type:complete
MLDMAKKTMYIAVFKRGDLQYHVTNQTWPGILAQCNYELKVGGEKTKVTYLGDAADLPQEEK